MKNFMNENFLLTNRTAKKLYHKYAKEMPIFDYHCHLPIKSIVENKKFRSITEVWLGGDHYKWRAMRTIGVDEKYITGDASDKEKFLKWAETLPKCIGNPLYHWTQLELKRYFGIDKLLSPKTAAEIWDKCNALLAKDEFSVRALIEKSNVKVICTTDDPADSLEYHQILAKDTTFKVKVLPAFRPDRSLNIENDGFVAWVAKLEQAADMKVSSFADFKAALLQRIEFFHAVGCRLSDHALDPIVFAVGTETQIDAIFQKALAGEKLLEDELKVYKTQVMLFLGKHYARLGWTMQVHVGSLRSINRRALREIGPETGFDTVADFVFADALAKFLDELDNTDELPRTILYCLNPRDNEVLGAMIGCFQGNGIPGKIQFGSGWWFNDQKDGMIRQMVTLANFGLLSQFIGMLTDSRSFLSYTRHEYFRRILCNLIGEWVEAGEAPNDLDLLGKMVQDICFSNAQHYFGIEY
jgi:glucuronate isomerase